MTEVLPPPIVILQSPVINEKKIIDELNNLFICAYIACCVYTYMSIDG